MLIVLLCLVCCVTMVNGKASQQESSTLYQRRFQEHLDYQVKTCSDDSNYDLPLCVKYRQRMADFEITKAKAEEKRLFFQYCQEHPYELRCFGTSTSTNDLIVITGVLTSMIALYLA